MWHEARRQEKKIRGMMVDYRKRAERRRNFYEKFKADPTQFIQMHGRPCKIHIDASIAAAGDASSIMMPWQGHHDLMIDRFDVRAHLDYIQESPSQPSAPDEELSTEDRHTNYERYRILVQNDYLGVEEEKFLHQIYLEEQFGPIALKQNVDGVIEKEKDKEKEKRKKGAAIAFTYDEPAEPPPPAVEEDSPDSETDDDSEFDFDLCLDLSEVDTASAHELNRIGQRFGLVSNDFYSYLVNDVEEQETQRLAREQEEEKAMYSGRRARRERQAYREKRLVGRVVSPPSYAARQSPVYEKFKGPSRSKSRSPSPDNGGEITYITSFSGEEPASQPVGQPIPTIPKKPAPSKLHRSHSPLAPARPTRRRLPSKSPRRSRSRSRDSSARRPRKRISPYRSRRSRSLSRSRYRRSRSRSRSRSRDRYDRRSRSRSLNRYRRSRSRSCSRRRSRSRSYRRFNRSRSWANSKSRSKSHSPRRSANRLPSPRHSSPTSTTDKTDGQPAVPRYYGRNRKESSSSIDLSSGDDDAMESAGPVKSDSGRAGAGVSGRSDVNSAAKRQERETPQEKLKRRMQVLLSRQFKQDKRLEREKAEKAEQERLDRAAELRDIAIRIRRRERYLRHLSGEEGERDRSYDRDRSHSGERGNSHERDRSRGGSRDRTRGGSRDHARGVSRDRTRGGSRDRTRGGSRDRTRGGSRDRARGGSRDRTRIGSRDRDRRRVDSRNQGSDRRRGDSRERRSSPRKSRSPRSSGDENSYGKPPIRPLVQY